MPTSYPNTATSKDSNTRATLLHATTKTTKGLTRIWVPKPGIARARTAGSLSPKSLEILKQDARHRNVPQTQPVNGQTIHSTKPLCPSTVPWEQTMGEQLLTEECLKTVQRAKTRRWAWRHTPVIPAGNREFKARVKYVVALRPV